VVAPEALWDIRKSTKNNKSIPIGKVRLKIFFMKPGTSQSSDYTLNLYPCFISYPMLVFLNILNVLACFYIDFISYGGGGNVGVADGKGGSVNVGTGGGGGVNVAVSGGRGVFVGGG
jgi:hypothetical protein